MLSKDGEKLYYLTSFEKGNDLWAEVRTRETKLFNKLGANAASMELSPDGKFLFVIGDGRAVKVDTESGSPSRSRSTRKWSWITRPRRPTSSTTAGVNSNRSWCSPTCRKSIGTSITRQEVPPHINNNYDFAEMLSEMLGEMNVSHTGAYYRQRSELRRHRLTRPAL